MLVVDAVVLVADDGAHEAGARLGERQRNRVGAVGVDGFFVLGGHDAVARPLHREAVPHVVGDVGYGVPDHHVADGGGNGVGLGAVVGEGRAHEGGHFVLDREAAGGAGVALHIGGGVGGRDRPGAGRHAVGAVEALEVEAGGGADLGVDRNHVVGDLVAVGDVLLGDLHVALAILGVRLEAVAAQHHVALVIVELVGEVEADIHGLVDVAQVADDREREGRRIGHAGNVAGADFVVDALEIGKDERRIGRNGDGVVEGHRLGSHILVAELDMHVVAGDLGGRAARARLERVIDRKVGRLALEGLVENGGIDVVGDADRNRKLLGGIGNHVLDVERNRAGGGLRRQADEAIGVAVGDEVFAVGDPQGRELRRHVVGHEGDGVLGIEAFHHLGGIVGGGVAEHHLVVAVVVFGKAVGDVQLADGARFGLVGADGKAHRILGVGEAAGGGELGGVFVRRGQVGVEGPAGLVGLREADRDVKRHIALAHLASGADLAIEDLLFGLAVLQYHVGRGGRHYGNRNRHRGFFAARRDDGNVVYKLAGAAVGVARERGDNGYAAFQRHQAVALGRVDRPLVAQRHLLGALPEAELERVAGSGIEHAPAVVGHADVESLRRAHHRVGVERVDLNHGIGRGEHKPRRIARCEVLVYRIWIGGARNRRHGDADTLGEEVAVSVFVGAHGKHVESLLERIARKFERKRAFVAVAVGRVRNAQVVGHVGLNALDGRSRADGDVDLLGGVGIGAVERNLALVGLGIVGVDEDVLGVDRDRNRGLARLHHLGRVFEHRGDDGLAGVGRAVALGGRYADVDRLADQIQVGVLERNLVGLLERHHIERQHLAAARIAVFVDNYIIGLGALGHRDDAVVGRPDIERGGVGGSAQEGERKVVFVGGVHFDRRRLVVLERIDVDAGEVQIGVVAVPGLALGVVVGRQAAGGKAQLGLVAGHERAGIVVFAGHDAPLVGVAGGGAKINGVVDAVGGEQKRQRQIARHDLVGTDEIGVVFGTDRAFLDIGILLGIALAVEQNADHRLVDRRGPQIVAPDKRAAILQLPLEELGLVEALGIQEADHKTDLARRERGFYRVVGLPIYTHQYIPVGGVVVGAIPRAHFGNGVYRGGSHIICIQRSAPGQKRQYRSEEFDHLHSAVPLL